MVESLAGSGQGSDCRTRFQTGHRQNTAGRIECAGVPHPDADSDSPVALALQIDRYAPAKAG
ncbi:hypothetical protein D3C79_957800 [compost metagenome]